MNAHVINRNKPVQNEIEESLESEKQKKIMQEEGNSNKSHCG